MKSTTLKERIATDLENAIDDIFLKYQEELNITSGDIDPLDAFRLDEAQKDLTEIIEKVIRFQISTNTF